VSSNAFRDEPDLQFPGVSVFLVGRRAETELLGATAYELEPGARWADLHVHYANEELILVLEGTPTLHTLEGERRLETGELVACLRGPRGAHRLTNDSDRTARVLIVSTMNMPEIVEYPGEGDEARVLTMTEPPHTDAPYDERRGRLIRLFRRGDGRPVPPDRS
jgi:uncharacterized cupin superfamily protein